MAKAAGNSYSLDLQPPRPPSTLPPVVIPSMQAVTAWLALWNDDVRRELMEREPETLLSMGDPESLPMGARGQLLREFIKQHGAGDWRGFHLPNEELRRLAHPDLSGVVSELWEGKPTNPEARELLLTLIWLGAMEPCGPIAYKVALESEALPIERILAIRALIACGSHVATREVVESMMKEPERWPDQVIEGVVGDLFPQAVSAKELIILFERAFASKASRFSWSLSGITRDIDPCSEIASALRDGLANLIWQGRLPEPAVTTIEGRFNCASPALAQLCERQLVAYSQIAKPDPHLIWACVVACRLSGRDMGADEVERLTKCFQYDPILREAAFLREVALTAQLFSAERGWRLFHNLERRSLLGFIGQADEPWLRRILRGPAEHELRSVTIYPLIRLWNARGRSDVEIQDLQKEVADDLELSATLREQSAPPKVDPEYEQWRIENEQRTLEEEIRKREHERQQDESWVAWKKELLAKPEDAFAADQVAATTDNLYWWMWAPHRPGFTRYGMWEGHELKAEFGHQVAMRAEAAFKAVWRSHPPTVWSHRPPEERERILRIWAQGLCGLAAEARKPGWAAELTPNEALIAAAYATIEINGFPDWLPDLVESHAPAVASVIGGELAAELAAGPEQSHLSVLQYLSHANAGLNLKRLLAPRIRIFLAAWPPTFETDERSERSAHHLEQAFEILHELPVSEWGEIATTCAEHYAESPDGSLAMAWLRGLFRFDPERAVDVLEESLTSLVGNGPAFAVRIFAGLFGRFGIALRFSDHPSRTAMLDRLVRCVYLYIRPSDDREHEGVYTPDSRDDAQRARDFLLGLLLDTPGPAAQEVLRDLAEDPQFGHFPDRLRFLARQRVARDAERPPLGPAEVVLLEKRFEAPPGDRDSLFDVMLNRLDDLAHDLSHDDFSDRLTWQKISDESQLQRSLAQRLKGMAKNAYVVSREPEVADQKRNDIQLTAVRGDVKAVIEVKIADRRWSLSDLERALRDQLVGRYLRHETCRAGCLLLSYNGEKLHWRRTPSAKRLGFRQVVDYLASEAKKIEKENGYRLRLAVHGLDLTDPTLPEAHSAISGRTAPLRHPRAASASSAARRRG